LRDKGGDKNRNLQSFREKIKKKTYFCGNMSSPGEYLLILRKFMAERGAEYGISRMAVFGSVARGDETPESDVDLLVEFSRPVGIEFIDLGNALEKVLDRRVDVVSRRGIKDKYFKEIERDIVYV
jgi:predicted nucleotidyltransferase